MNENYLFISIFFLIFLLYILLFIINFMLLLYVTLVWLFLNTYSAPLPSNCASHLFVWSVRLLAQIVCMYVELSQADRLIDRPKDSQIDGYLVRVKRLLVKKGKALCTQYCIRYIHLSDDGGMEWYGVDMETWRGMPRVLDGESSCGCVWTGIVSVELVLCTHKYMNLNNCFSYLVFFWLLFN